MPAFFSVVFNYFFTFIKYYVALCLFDNYEPCYSRRNSPHLFHYRWVYYLLILFCIGPTLLPHFEDFQVPSSSVHGTHPIPQKLLACMGSIVVQRWTNYVTARHSCCMNRLDNIKQKLNEKEMKKIAGALMKIHKIDTTINSILLWRCDTTGSALDHTKNLFWHTINSGWISLSYPHEYFVLWSQS